MSLAREKHIIVILAGGSGSRLVPIYDEHRPKQFHDIFNTGQTLLQATFRRCLRSANCSEIYVATTEDFRQLVLEQLQSVVVREMNLSEEDASRYVVEHLIIDPARRDTAAAIVYATQMLYDRYSQDVLTFVPADHFMLREDSVEYFRMLKMLYDTVQRSYDVIALAGVPSHQTLNDALGHLVVADLDHYPVFRVGQFVEKPTREVFDAMVHGGSGEVRYSLGIITCCPGTLLDLAQEYLPAIHSVISGDEISAEAYQRLRTTSIGHALLSQEEVWPSLRVVQCTIGPWADLGTAEQIYDFAITHLRKAGTENVSIGSVPVEFLQCKRCVVISDGTCAVSMRDAWNILQIVHSGTVYTTRITQK